MADNPFGIIEQLNEAERAQYDALDKTPPPEELAREWRRNATVGWVKRYVDTHSRWCPALFLLRKLAVAALVVSALVLVLNVVGVVAAKAVFRQAVRQVLVEQNLIHACEPSSSSNQAQAVR